MKYDNSRILLQNTDPFYVRLFNRLSFYLLSLVAYSTYTKQRPSSFGIVHLKCPQCCGLNHEDFYLLVTQLKSGVYTCSKCGKHFMKQFTLP